MLQITMKIKSIMGSKLTYCILCLYLISCYTKLCFTFSILPAAGLSINSTANDISDDDRSNSSLFLDHTNQKQNGTTQISHLSSNESITADAILHQPNVNDLDMKNNEANTSPDSNGNDISSIDEDEDLSTLTNGTSSGNLTTLSLYNSTHSKICQHINFPSYVICQFCQGNNYIIKEVKTYFGGHKLLAVFLGMAGVLACLLILIYCIYIRQHKEDMFSHHRLYGEGFEDPVLHLDTPVDHLDFFSFRDTEITAVPMPQNKCHQTYDAKEDYRVEALKDTNEHLHQIIQMGSIKHS